MNDLPRGAGYLVTIVILVFLVFDVFFLHWFSRYGTWGGALWGFLLASCIYWIVLLSLNARA